MNDSAAAHAGVNRHYLAHVMAVTAAHSVEASEDIIAGNGMKLLAKGARIDPAAYERLLLHKLRKPLEGCVQIVDGVVPGMFGPMAGALLDQHALLLALCGSDRARSIPLALATLSLSTPVQALLTVYGEYQGDRLTHSVGVAMLAMALARRLRPQDSGHQQMIALAGLVHDVGELYIDPRYLRRDAALEPEQWRHIVTHPLVGRRVLMDMPGAGPAVAQAVLLHHERANGHGYPHGVAGERFTRDGQILGAAEWLMALIESGMSPLARASVATRLIPGEFDDDLVQIILTAARAAGTAESTDLDEAALADAILRVGRIVRVLDRFSRSRAWIDEKIEQSSGEAKRVMETALQRLLQVQVALSSTGLDSSEPEVLIRQLAALDDRHVQVEVLTIVHELEWRLRDLERRYWQKEAQLSPEHHAVLGELVHRLRGEQE